MLRCRICLLLVMITLLLARPVAAQLPDSPIPGTLVYIEDGRLFRYQDGEVESVCNVPIPDGREINGHSIMYSEPYDVAFAPGAGLVVFAARNYGEYPDFSLTPDHEDGATNMYLCDIHTGEYKRISPDPAVGFLHIAPVFSEDEARIAWLATDNFSAEVFIYDIESSQVSSAYQLPNALADNPLFMFNQMRPLAWDCERLALRAQIRDEGDVLTIIDTERESFTEQRLVLGDYSEITFRNILTWAVTENGPAIVYGLGSDSVLYYAPHLDEHIVSQDVLLISPAEALTSDDIPALRLVLYENLANTGSWRLAAIPYGPNGPGTYNGPPGGFAFSPDGQYLAMLVNEGMNLRDGNDIYIMDSRDTFGALGFRIDAQLVGDAPHDWNSEGPQRIFWGRSRAGVDVPATGSCDIQG